MDGVISTQVGYSGGKFPFPTYQSVCSGITGHSEVVWMRYDPSKVQYKDLLLTFWKNHSAYSAAPTQYMSAIFYTTKEQEKVARASFDEIASQRGRAPSTKIIKAGKFHQAEDYHQHYLAKRRKNLF